MFKRFFMLLLALSLLGAFVCHGADETAKKAQSTKAAPNTKNTKISKKNKRQQKAQRKKQRQAAFAVRAEFKKIHEWQKELMRNVGNEERTKKLNASISSSMKKIAPQLKIVGAIRGSGFMTDISKLVKEGKSLASEPEKYPDNSMLELLQEHQIQQLGEFIKKVSE